MKFFNKFKDGLSRERFSLGLDIGTTSIKLVKLKFSKDTVELSSFNLEPIQLDLETVLKNIIKSQDTKRVNLSVSGPSAIIRYVNFPRMNSEELKQALKFEVQKYIPFSVDEVNIDSFILKEDLPDNKMLVLLAAVKKEFLEQRLKIIESAGLKASIVDIDSLALVNAFNFNYAKDSDILKNKTIALLNIGAAVSNLNILEDGIPRLSRDIQIAGNNFTQKLMDIFGLDFKSAEELKINPDKERLQKASQTIEAVLTNLGSEVRTSFDYYESQSASNVIKIFLSGGSTLFSGLKDTLANLLSIEVESWDPIGKINIGNSVDAEKVKAVSNQLAVAIGLALR